MTWTFSTNKSSTSFSTANKSSTTWDELTFEAGGGYPYNLSSNNYNSDFYYNSAKYPTAWNYKSKN